MELPASLVAIIIAVTSTGAFASDYRVGASKS